jgi:hypothetical protein
MSYIRSSDGQSVTESEALDASRRLRDGYLFGMLKEGDHIGFDMAFMDGHPVRSGHRMTFTDALPPKPPLTDGEAVRNLIRDNRSTSGVPITRPASGAVSAEDLRATRDMIRANRNL